MSAGFVFIHHNDFSNFPDFALDWFQNFTDKGNCTFIQVGIEGFYPSITKCPMAKAIEHTKLYTSINHWAASWDHPASNKILIVFQR